jgi:LPXTG-motif cell wall-anchored protein
LSFALPNPEPGTTDGLGGGTGGAGSTTDPSTGPGLANTGSSPILATVSVLLMSTGGVLLVASRRERNDD